VGVRSPYGAHSTAAFACGKTGKPHILNGSPKPRKSVPISVDAAHTLITDLLSEVDVVEKPQPWVFDLGDAYACGSNVYLQEPPRLPTT
jgi:hypothetical protein